MPSPTTGQSPDNASPSKRSRPGVWLIAFLLTAAATGCASHTPAGTRPASADQDAFLADLGRVAGASDYSFRESAEFIAEGHALNNVGSSGLFVPWTATGNVNPPDAVDLTYSINGHSDILVSIGGDAWYGRQGSPLKPVPAGTLLTRAYPQPVLAWLRSAQVHRANDGQYTFEILDTSGTLLPDLGTSAKASGTLSATKDGIALTVSETVKSGVDYQLRITCDHVGTGKKVVPPASDAVSSG
jgi:hypothetical protein